VIELPADVLALFEARNYAHLTTVSPAAGRSGVLGGLSWAVSRQKNRASLQSVSTRALWLWVGAHRRW
jgi:hypothetical protein